MIKTRGIMNVAENVRAFSFAKINLLIRSAYVLSKHNGKLVSRFI